MTISGTAGGTERTGQETLGAVRAARELGLRPSEFDLAVELGRIRTGPAPAGRPRVARTEIDRHRAGQGFPDTLRESLRTVGTADGAALMHIASARFARLARLGCFEPVSFYCNRYGAVVWLYLAQDLKKFAAEQPELLAGPLPAPLRDRLDAGHDGRARSWRQRRAAQLLNRAEDPWQTSAVMAAMLDADTLALVVEDPGDRERLRDLRPRLVPARHGTATADTARRLFLAEDHEELMWARMVLGLHLQAIKEPAPGRRGRPEPPAPAAAEPGPAPAEPTARAAPSSRGGPLRWLRRHRRT